MSDHSYDTDTQEESTTLGQYLTSWMFLIIISGAIGWCAYHAITIPAVTLAKVVSVAVVLLTGTVVIGAIGATWHFLVSTKQYELAAMVCGKKYAVADRIWQYGFCVILLSLGLAVLWCVGMYIITGGLA